MTNFIEEFHDALRQRGFSLKTGGIVVDNKWHTCLAHDGKSKGTYTVLEIDSGFAIGQFFDRRDDGTRHNWHSKSNENLTPEERETLTKVLRQQQAARKKEDERKRARVARRIAPICARMPKATKHPYLTAKGILPNGAKIRKKGNELIIPFYDIDGKTPTLQRIMYNGKKFLFKGGRKKGSYFPLAQSGENLDIFLIAEGFSTAASIREATGLPSICAIDGGNLKAVALNIKKKYPDCKIVFCADNDAYTRKPDGSLWNVGVEKAKDAAMSIDGAHVITPNFDNVSRETEPTDFNDLHSIAGLDEVKSQIMSILNKIPARQEEAVGEVSGVPCEPDQQSLSGGNPDDEEWQRKMIYSPSGKLVKTSLQNYIMLLQHHEDYKNMFRYDKFAQTTMIVRPPSWKKEEEFKIRQVSDTDYTRIAGIFEYMNLSPSRDKVACAIEAVAEEDSFHPAQDYFNSLTWDGVPRLDSWLQTYLGANGDDPAYLAFVGKKWLTAAVTRIFRAGCKFDHILVIEGSQGAGKSTALRTLATFGDDDERVYVQEGVTISAIQNKDTIQQIQGHIFVELAELAGFGKKNDDDVKRWITLQEDTCRLPYMRKPVVFKRQFVLSATTNDYNYLKDPTGNRRYWCIRIGYINIELLKADRMQLWAEAVKCYKEGLYLGATKEESALAEVAQEKRLTEDAWSGDVLTAAHDISWTGKAFQLSKLMEQMGLSLKDRDFKAQGRVTKILRSNGYESASEWSGGKSIRGWKKIVAKKQEEMF